jgi:hypothetical protein
MSVLFAACMFTCIALVVLIVFPFAFTTSVALLLERGASTRQARYPATIAAALGDALFVLLCVLPTISNAQKWGMLGILALLDLGFFLGALYLSSPARAVPQVAAPNGVVWARFFAPLLARVAPQLHSK